MSTHAKLTGDLAARRLVEARWPRNPDPRDIVPVKRIAHLLAQVGADANAPGDWHLEFARLVQAETVQVLRASGKLNNENTP